MGRTIRFTNLPHALTVIAGIVLSALPGFMPSHAAPTIVSPATPTTLSTSPPTPTTTAPTSTAIAAAIRVPATLTSAPTSTPVRVPPEFQSLYNELDNTLTTFNKSYNPSGASSPVVFAVELLPANGNRGMELLDPQALVGVRTFLDAMQKLGVQGVVVGIKYPMLTPNFPNSAQYLEFFKNVANEVHSRDMILDVEMGAVWPTPISPLGVSFKGLTLDQFKAGVRQMAAPIIAQVQPDYLDLDSEPDTEAVITGFCQLTDPQVFADAINYVLKDLNRGNTLIGAGSGSWSGIEFVKDLGANTSADFITLHVYPIMGQDLTRTAELAELAHQYHKRVILDEMSLYKADTSEPLTGLGAELEMERLNTYDFWAPLDQKFLTTMAKRLS